MADNGQQQIFREETLQRISSPEQLTNYLRVTNPGIWAILAAVILIMAGLFVWSAVGTLETSADAKVIVEGHVARVVTVDSQALEAGMTLRVSSQETLIASAETDEYGRAVGLAEVSLPDGTYDGTVVVSRMRPVDFLLSSR